MKTSDTQYRALHLWFQKMADALNAAGYDYKAFLKAVDYRLDVPFNKQLFKDQVWRPWQIYHTMNENNPEGIISTLDITPGQLNQIHEIVNQKIGEHTGVYVPWPTEQELMRELNGNRSKPTGEV